MTQELTLETIKKEVSMSQLINEIANNALDNDFSVEDIEIGDENSCFRIDQCWHHFQQYQSELRIECSIYTSCFNLKEVIGEEKLSQINAVLPSQSWDHNNNYWDGKFIFPDDDEDMQDYDWTSAKIRLVEELEVIFGL